MLVLVSTLVLGIVVGLWGCFWLVRVVFCGGFPNSGLLVTKLSLLCLSFGCIGFGRSVCWVACVISGFGFSFFLFSNYCHTSLHLGILTKLRIWQVSACKMKPQSGIILSLNRQAT